MRVRDVMMVVGVSALGFVLARVPPRAVAAPAPARWECTRFKVPESLNPSIRGADGAVLTPPPELGTSVRPLLTTVILPDGFQPFGGGDGSVIACRTTAPR